jgi:hypothetical protein
MEPEGLLPHLQVPDTCPYPEPDRSSPCPPPLVLPEEPSYTKLHKYLPLVLMFSVMFAQYLID